MIECTPANSSRNLHLCALSVCALSSPTLSVQPLWFQPLTHYTSQRPPLNPFAISPLRTLSISTEGAYPQWRCPHDSDPLECLSLFPISFIFQSRAHSLHFFALPKNSTLLFSSDSALCVKKHNHRGVGKGVRQRSTSSCGVLANSARPKWPTLSRLRGTPVTSHQSLPLGALPFARGCRSARIRIEPHDT